MGDAGRFVSLLVRIYGIFRIIFCLHFQFPDEIENTKSLRERERERDGGQWSEEKEEKEEIN